MADLSALIILVLSFGGMVFLIAKRTPQLRALELLPQEDVERKPLKQRIRERVAGLGASKSVTTEKLLRKLLMRTKILLLKGERRTDQYLRRVSHSKRFKEDYWRDINRP
jgi:hypothetical protein